MSNQQLFIPERIKVGFQGRHGTYTGKLAYVIYFDEKGVLRKEKSWQSWRSKAIEPIEFENTPTEGFVLNKGVGGARQSYGWNTRNEYIRVYDPRDFEFEISVANLLFILRECDCSKGKGLEGKFVYAWDGTELVLLPVETEDYKNSQEFTELKALGVSAKALIPGATYLTKKQKSVVYIGRFNYYFVVSRRYGRVSKADEKGMQKRYLFLEGDKLRPYDNVSFLARVTNETPITDYAEQVDKFTRSVHASPVKRLFLKPKEEGDKTTGWFVEQPDGSFLYYYSYMDNGEVVEIRLQCRYSLKCGVFSEEHKRGCAKNPSCTGTKHDWGYYDKIPWVEPTNLNLWAELENGTVCEVMRENFHKE